jgi:hypothetical protein
MASGLPHLKPAFCIQFADYLSHLHVLPTVVNATAFCCRPTYRGVTHENLVVEMADGSADDRISTMQ